MIKRDLQQTVELLLTEQAAVTLLGPRQVGKTTLAHQIADTRESIYFDLENPEDAAVLGTPGDILSRYSDRLVILDEIQRIPGLFEPIRGLIDAYRREGHGTGKFLFLGSASIDLLRQTSETLAGRIAYRELGPLNLLETAGIQPGARDMLWIRGGFPNSFLAKSDRASMTWRRDFVRSYLERDIPQFDSRVPGETLRRFWTMLAHNQGSLLNASKLAAALAIDTRTLNRYLDLLVDLLLVRRLQPWHGNIKKRLVRSPKTYLRDSGMVHSLLGLTTLEEVLSHPVAGASWEGFVIENLLAVVPNWVQPFFYRTARGAEIDLVLEFSPDQRWAIEIKRTANRPQPSRGFTRVAKTSRRNGDWWSTPAGTVSDKETLLKRFRLTN
ncbi:ATP-binding protein [Kineobactrum salinum]|uniref:ATP-binding protein n=1 Tax=Kineobactrum salinum TaxID=2708301 RepID=UPI0018D8BA30|nr:ATP-binding protein [Kineobactrum salinum]